jgi:hypothetical protein
MVVRDAMGVGHPPLTIQAFQSNIVVKDVETILSRDVIGWKYVAFHKEWMLPIAPKYPFR